MNLNVNTVSANTHRKKSGSAPALQYVPLPTPPDFGANPATILNYSTMGSSITQAELGVGIKRGLVPNPYVQRLQTNGLVGTEADPIIFKSQSDLVRSWIGGSAITSGQKIITQTGAPISDWVEFHHLGVFADPGLASSTGISWIGQSGGSSLLLSDIVIKDMASPSWQFNGDGDAGTYKNIKLRFLRGIGLPTGTEGGYNGDTSTPPTNYGIIDNLLIEHCLINQKGWDGLGCNSVRHLTMRNCTIYGVGLLGVSGQKNGVQAQNIGTGGLIENCVFWDCGRAAQIAARGFTLRNCVFYSDQELLYQDLETAGYNDGVMANNDPTLYDNCYFFSRIPRAYAVDHREDLCKTTYLNCKMDANSGAFLLDNRAVKNNDLYPIDIIGTQLAVPIPPTFNHLNPDLDDHGLIQEPFYRINHFGYRN